MRTTDRPRCCLIVGHRPGEQGAISADGTSEFEFNEPLARAVAGAVCGIEVQIVYRDDNAKGLQRLPAKVNLLKPDFLLELHFNASGPRTASGSEVLYWHTSKLGEVLAETLLAEIALALRLPVRGTKPRKGRWVNAKWQGENGSYLLGLTAAPAVLAEPFFGDNPLDWSRAMERRDLLIMSYKRAIESYGRALQRARDAFRPTAIR